MIAPRSAIAEDAVQAAAMYCLERLDRFQFITSSYFIQKAVNCARDTLKADNRRHKRMRPVGEANKLVAWEEIAEKNRRGRRSPAPRLSQIEGDADER